MLIKRSIEEPFLEDSIKHFDNIDIDDIESCDELIKHLSNSLSYLSDIEKRIIRSCEAEKFDYSLNFEAEQDYTLDLTIHISMQYLSEETEEEVRRKNLFKLIKEEEEKERIKQNEKREYELYLRLSEKFSKREQK